MNDVDPHALKLLRDIDASARRIVARLDGVTREEFVGATGIDIQDIVARRLGIIGEAAAALFKKHGAFCEAHPEIPLRQARGIRNILIHDYDGIDWNTVWNAATRALPELLKAVEPFIRQHTTPRPPPTR